MTTPPAILRKNRSALLDCIRAVAVTSVVWYHVAVSYAGNLPDRFAWWISKFGLFGVDVFYPLSGYLITKFLLAHSERSGMRVFFLRRVFRIIPLYYAALLAYVLGSLIVGVDRDIIHNIWKNLLFLTGWSIFLDGREVVPYTITWSLSVEELAYLLFGVAAYQIRRSFPLFLLIITVAAMSYRFFLVSQGAVDIYFFPPARLDSIALGGLAAWAMSRNFPTLSIMTGLLIVSMVLGIIGHTLSVTLLYTKISLATCLVIVLFETRLAGLTLAPIRFAANLGFYSYFVYLIHYFNIDILHRINEHFELGLGFWLSGLIALAATWLQAIISYRYFEGPLMLFGRTLEPAPGTARPKGAAIAN